MCCVPASRKPATHWRRSCRWSRPDGRGRRGTAIGARPERIRFYADVVEALAPQGGLLWHVLTVGPHVVAMELLLRAGTMLVVHKATFDEVHSKASPGHVLWEQTLRWAARSPEIHEVELLTFDHMAQRWGGLPCGSYQALMFLLAGLMG
ncbi:MAG: GNAT family N-acetyltransferase [Gammaproteobacteria bacterium]|nr:GNAT family N-acetyltransferase [Gammaproteobacteria bacterium]